MSSECNKLFFEKNNYLFYLANFIYLIYVFSRPIAKNLPLVTCRAFEVVYDSYIVSIIRPASAALPVVVLLGLLPCKLAIDWIGMNCASLNSVSTGL